MTKRRAVAIVAISLALLVLAGWHLTRTEEPTYEGKPFSYWFPLYYERGDITAAEAIRKMGPEAVPIMIENIDFEYPEWKSKLRHRYNSLIGNRCNAFKWGLDWRTEFPIPFEALDSETEQFAINKLVEMLRSCKQNQKKADFIQFELHMRGKAAVPALVSVLTNSSPDSAALAALTLGKMGNRGGIAAIPALRIAMQNPSPIVRDAASAAELSLEQAAMKARGLKK